MKDITDTTWRGLPRVQKPCVMCGESLLYRYDGWSNFNTPPLDRQEIARAVVDVFQMGPICTDCYGSYDFIMAQRAVMARQKRLPKSHGRDVGYHGRNLAPFIHTYQ